VCNGKRYNRETLLVTFDNHTIADFLSMTVNQAMESCLKDIPAIHQKLSTLQDVGLGYIQLGQSATTLSGGEAQRIKLAKELSRPQTGNTLYLLDEPTTGLHFKDIQNLLAVLQRLVDMGNTVIVIEHNLDVIKTADYVIDLGPDGGNNGGTIVGFGTPENLAKIKASVTGQYLAPLLQ
jgi:excinuclease ABC subunit A